MDNMRGLYSLWHYKYDQNKKENMDVDQKKKKIWMDIRWLWQKNSRDCKRGINW